MDTEKDECILDDRWLKREHQRWKEAGRVAPPDKSGALLDHTVQQWQMVTALMQGDEEAGNALYEAYFDRVYLLAFHIVRNPEMAEDVAMECLCKILQYRDRLKPEQGIVRFIFKVAKQCSVSALRPGRGIKQESLDEIMEQGEVELLPLVEDEDDPAELAEQKLAEEIVLEEVSKLPEHYRRAVELCFFSELSLAKAGEVLGITSTAVRARRDHALAILRQQLAERLGDDGVINGGETK